MNPGSDDARKAIFETLIAKLESMPDEQRSTYIRQLRDNGTLEKMSKDELVKLLFGPDAKIADE